MPLALLLTGRLRGKLGTPATFESVAAPWVFLGTELLGGGNSSCHTGPAASPSVQFSTHSQ